MYDLCNISGKQTAKIFDNLIYILDRMYPGGSAGRSSYYSM